MSLHARVLLMLSANAALALLASFIARTLGAPANAALVAGFLIAVPAMFWTALRIVRVVDRGVAGLEDGLRAFRDADFSMRLASRRNEHLARVKGIYNDVADVLRTRRNDVYQKELLLDTILQRTPVAVVLVNAADRVVFANAAARELFAPGERLDARRFGEVIERIAGPMRETLDGGADGIVTVRSAEQDETFHVAQRTFHLNTLRHRLILVERLTTELRRQEIAVWKNAIRIINHELNNTIAPISSMIHSARLAQERPDRHHQLAEIYATIEERLAFLRAFLESYAQFARLPAPRQERTSWQAVLDDVRALYEFRVEGSLREESMIDRAQLQQVLINLVKNAHESGSDPADVVVSVQRGVEGIFVRVLDRGRGMSEEVLRHALVPFFTTKPSGSGLGLALCNEVLEAHNGRMRLTAREGGGTVVTCWVP